MAGSARERRQYRKRFLKGRKRSVRPVSLVGCGRTDAGVHAEVYAANFRGSCSIPLIVCCLPLTLGFPTI